MAASYVSHPECKQTQSHKQPLINEWLPLVRTAKTTMIMWLAFDFLPLVHFLQICFSDTWIRIIANIHHYKVCKATLLYPDYGIWCHYWQHSGISPMTPSWTSLKGLNPPLSPFPHKKCLEWLKVIIKFTCSPTSP